MTKQLHRRLSTEEVKMFLQKHEEKVSLPTIIDRKNKTFYFKALEFKRKFPSGREVFLDETFFQTPEGDSEFPILC